MTKRESKVQASTTIQVFGRDATRRGRLELSPGHVHYYRVNGQDAALGLTYQQLIDLFEAEIEFRSIDVRKKLAPPANGEGFQFLAHGDHIMAPPEIEANVPYGRIYPHHIDAGVQNVFSEHQRGRKRKPAWQAHFSMHSALAALGGYIDRVLEPISNKHRRSENVPITRPEMRHALLQLLKRLG